MPRVFVCLFVLFILSIAIRFSDCENTTTRFECEEDIIPSSNETELSPFEQKLKKYLSSLENVQNWWDKILGKDKDNSQSNEEGFPSNIPDKLGPLWCSNGNGMSNIDPLGIFKETDACCRAHSECTKVILPGKTEFNVVNTGIFTRSACFCDRNFHFCLLKADNIIAKTIGWTYFDLLQLQCFDCACSINTCMLDGRMDCKDPCKKYKWFHSPRFL